jgi:hypothetical protein
MNSLYYLLSKVQFFATPGDNGKKEGGAEGKWQKTAKPTVNSRGILFFRRSSYEEYNYRFGVFPGRGGADI